MKTVKYYIVGLIGLCSLTGCSDFLDRYPQDAMSDQSFFTSETDLEYYMNGLYNENIIRKQSSLRWNDLNKANDDVVGSSPADALMQHSTSGVASEKNDTWNNSYDYIRKANYFLANAHKVGNMSAVGKHFLGEGFYCRAAKYFDLLQTFGGVPYIDKVLDTESEELYKQRDSRQFVAERIIADLDSAVMYLQWKGEGKAKAGRINKEAALVLQTRVALYEGSWEYYHGRKGTKFQVSGQDGTAFLKKAAEAGEMLIQKHGGNLYKGSKGNEYFEYFNQMDYSNIPGAFLYKCYSRSLAVIQTWCRSYAEGTDNGITKSAVNSYLMKDGKPAEVSDIVFDPKSMNSLAENKDPRLAQTIWAPNKGRFYDYMPAIPNAHKTSYPGLIQNQQRRPSYSGYRIWKGVSFDAAEFDNGEVDDLIIRYEEGLLNFAEAKAILGTITQDDLNKSVNYIRARVGMPGMNLSEINSWNIAYKKQEGYDTGAPNIVNEIRRERRVELMLEGLRLSDIKRWAMFDDVFNGWKPVGAYAQEYLDYWNDAEKVLADGFDWKKPEEVILTQGNNFDVIDGWINPLYKNADFKVNSGRGYYIDPDRDYLSSIPRSEILLYEEKAGVTLEQNPGWY